MGASTVKPEPDTEPSGIPSGIRQLRRHRADIRLVADAALAPIAEELPPALLDRLAGTIARRVADHLAEELTAGGSHTPVIEMAADPLQLVRGSSAVMQRLRDRIRRVAPTSLHVLVSGESGTGRELVARSLHALSRRPGRLECLDCRGLSPQRMRRELFGHVRGSLPGSAARRDGLLARAAHGTLFLQGLALADPDVCLQLEQAVTSGCFSAVGSATSLPCATRLVIAVDPAYAEPDALDDGPRRRLAAFDEVEIRLPPLRRRAEDIDELVAHFLRHCSLPSGQVPRFQEDALTAMKRHHWPGNVRELRSFVERTASLVNRPAIAAGDLPPFFRPKPPFAVVAGTDRQDPADHGLADTFGCAPARAIAPQANLDPVPPGRQPTISGWRDAASPGPPVVTAPIGTSIAAMERMLILATLDHCSGAKERTADLLGISLKTLYNRLRDYRLSTDSSDAAANER